MILISHRGNTLGIDEERENSPSLIDSVLKMGYDIEIDVWKIDNKIFLGHDGPEHEIDLDFLKNDNLWCHAKNLEALEYMLENKIHCFWHQEDDFTLTSKGYIWTYPEKRVCKKSIIVCKTEEETRKYYNKDIAGICSDYIEGLK